MSSAPLIVVMEGRGMPVADAGDSAGKEGKEGKEGKTPECRNAGMPGVARENRFFPLCFRERKAG